jgi:hypothetical protein
MSRTGERGGKFKRLPIALTLQKLLRLGSHTGIPLRAATDRYLKALQRIKEGKDPGNFYFDDFDE